LQEKRERKVRARGEGLQEVDRDAQLKNGCCFCLLSSRTSSGKGKTVQTLVCHLSATLAKKIATLLFQELEK
jgi:hypothetical protein